LKHDDLLPHLRDAEQRLGKDKGQTDTAMRRRISGQITPVNGNTIPCQPLHEWHWCVAVEVGFMVHIFLQNIKNTRRRFFAFFPRRNGAEAN
jgi:hypothetical protein